MIKSMSFRANTPLGRIPLWFFAALVPLAALDAQNNYDTPYTFVTIAGSAHVAGSTDGAATVARLGYPEGVAVDSVGNIYVADWFYSTIRKISTNPTTGEVIAVSTLAGSPSSRALVDGPGSTARFNRAKGVAVDPAGNIFVADTGNNMIRRITPGGDVTSYAGAPNTYGSTDGSANAAKFAGPASVAVDSLGNLFVADRENHTIRKIIKNPATGEISVTTLAGSAGSYGSADGSGDTARFHFPSGVAVDSSGNVYVADYWNDSIRKITTNTGTGVVTVTTLAGLAGANGSTDGTGSAARFTKPTGVAVDSSGYVYVADSENNMIRRISPSGVVTTLAGTTNGNSADGSGNAVRFDSPRNVAVDSAGVVFVSDRNNCTIRRGTETVLPPSIDGFGVGKKQDFLQNSAAAPSSHTIMGDPVGPFHYSAYLSGTNLHKLIPTPTVSLPNLTQYPLAGDRMALGIDANYATKSALDAAFPNGSYSFAAGSSTLPITFGVTDAYPVDIPKITNGIWDGQGMLVVNAVSGTTINFSSFSTYLTGTGAIASFNLYTVSGNTVGSELTSVESANLSGLRTDPLLTSYTIPAGLLQPNQIYYAELSFGRIATLNTSFFESLGAVGMAAFLNTTGFMISTAPPLAAPVITTQPLGQTAGAGSGVALSVAVSGNPTPSLQWRKNGVDIAGANSATFSLNPVQLSDAGTYTVVASNSVGSATSEAAVLTVNESLVAPLITGLSPTRTVLTVGQNLSLGVTVIVTGAPSYQWYRNGNPIVGATGNGYAVSSVSVTDSGWYQVTISNAYGTTHSAPLFIAVTPAATQARAWGWNSFGQATVPTDLVNPLSICAGNEHSLALLRDGTVVAWGNNTWLQRNVPVGLANVVALAAGARHSLALKSDGTVVAWGDFSYGQSTIPPGLAKVVAIAANYRQSLALKNDGTVVAWGDNTWGQINIPSGLANVVAIAAGAAHSLALKSDGTVVSWGASGTSVPSGLANVVAIAAGAYHSMALRQDGTVVTWSSDYQYPNTVPAGLANVVRIAAGGVHSLAIKSDGSLVGWGSNNYTAATPPIDLGSANYGVSGGGSFSLVVYDANPPPTIATQPLSQAVGIGGSVTFGVSVNGVSPFSFQWKKGGVNINGATGSSYTITGVGFGDAAGYTVVATNSVGSVTSNAAFLTVIDAPSSAVISISVE